MLSPCCKKDSFVWYKSKSKSSNNVDVTCTTDNHDKPTLFKCKSCKLIFSEYYNSSFENSYTDVVDEKYIKQKKRLVCLNCKYKISNYTFLSFKVKYLIFNSS